MTSELPLTERPLGSGVPVPTVHFVVPAGIDDPRTPSGGNRYDREARDGLRAAGRSVLEHPVTGSWPAPSDGDRARLSALLGTLPDGATVLLDGLVACGVPEVLVPAATRLRVVVLVHLPLGDEVGAPAVLAEREGHTLRAAHAVVATSPWAAERVRVAHGLPADRVHVAAPGVSPAPRSAGTAGGGRLLCVGALTRTKGQDLLVEALAAVADRTWWCDLIGPPGRDHRYLAELDRAIARYGLAARVRLVGPLHTDALADAYQGADLLVLPSRAETYGMVVTEALARAIPVLAAAVGGVPATLNGVPVGRAEAPATLSGAPAGREDDLPGLLVPPEDVLALAAALRRWFDEPDLRTRLRHAAGRRRSTLSGWEVTTRCLTRILDRLS